MLYPLTINDYTAIYSFDVTNKIQDINPNVFDDGFVFVSFDVESLFTNVPLQNTIDIISRRIFDENRLSTKLTKRSLKKLIKDSCSKTTFLFNNQMYEQTDGVSMGSSLGPVIANIFMTEIEEKLISPMITDGTIRFYTRYVDDTLVLIKLNDLDMILQKLNSFHKNIKFTVDTFTGGPVHFLDLLIDGKSIDIYYKDTHTGQYTDFSSFTPWPIKIAWVKSLFNRAKTACSTRLLLDKQILLIKRFMSWNSFPKYVRNAIINKLMNKPTAPGVSNSPFDDPNTIKLWIRLPYCGPTGEKLARSLIRKISRFLIDDVKIILLYNTTKMSFFCSNKDPIPTTQKSNIIYEIKCPGCGQVYIGKSDRCFLTRLHEHGQRDDQPMHRHFSNCSAFHEFNSFNHLPDINQTAQSEINHSEIIHNTVLQNSKIIAINHNFSQLCFLEAYFIKQNKPAINDGLKASKELVLFK